MNNRVEICGVNTSKLKLLTEDEKEDLMNRIKAGDKKAYDRFIMGNLRLVLSVTQRFAGRGECMDDLFQVGCIGLIKAVENFNTDLEVRFSTYAVPMIIGELRRYLRDNTTLRVSRSLRDTAYKALRVRNDLMDRLSREPRLDEIDEFHAALLFGAADALQLSLQLRGWGLPPQVLLAAPYVLALLAICGVLGRSTRQPRALMQPFEN